MTDMRCWYVVRGGGQGVHLDGNELIKHNLVVFNNGEGALKTLPGLIDTIPEARLNLVRHPLTSHSLTHWLTD